MLEQLDKMVDKMPFAGQYAIRPAMKSYVRAPSAHEERYFAMNTLLLGGLIAVHLIQARLGVEAFSNHAEALNATGDPYNAFLMSIDATYCTANTAVTIRQTMLLDKLRQIRERRQQSHTPKSVKSRKIEETGKTERIPSAWQHLKSLGGIYTGRPGLAVAFTLAGSLTFTGSYIDSHEKMQGIECVTQARSDLAGMQSLQRSEIGKQAFDQIWSNRVAGCGLDPADIPFSPNEPAH